MGRPRKNVRDAGKPPREFNAIQRIVEMALTLFRLTGGDSLDLQLRSMDRTAEMYQMQTDAALQYGNEAAGAYGPNVSTYEARMSASTYARLNAQREKKMAQCMAWAEEGAEADALRKAAGGSPPSSGNSASNGTSASSGTDIPVGAAERSEAVEAAKAQAAPKDGDSPSAKSGRGQSPLGGQPPEAGSDEFCDATKPLHREAATTRIAQMLSGLQRG
jgi:hypothetical protein